MGAGKKAGMTTKEYLENAPLPTHASTYTVIPHKFVIEHALRLLAENGLEVERELYKCNTDADIAQGMYHLKNSTDPEMTMMFAWANSYNKQMRFKCAIGGSVIASGGSIIAGDHSSYGRVHKGNADAATIENMTLQITNAAAYYNQLVADKKAMKDIMLTAKQRAEILGRLVIDNEFLTMEQLGIIKKELKDISYDCNADTDSLWTFYNHIIFALKVNHPRTWLDRQKQIHHFLCVEFSIKQSIVVPTNIVTPIVVVETIPGEEADVVNITVPENQVDLEDMIAEVEAEEIINTVVTEKAEPLVETLVLEKDKTGDALVSATFKTVDFSQGLNTNDESPVPLDGPSDSVVFTIPMKEEQFSKGDLTVTPEVKEAVEEIISEVEPPIIVRKSNILTDEELKQEEEYTPEQLQQMIDIERKLNEKKISFDL